MSNPYFEKCVQRLSSEKQTIAREAYASITENGDDSLICKFLFVLSVCTDAVLEEIVTAGEKLNRDAAKNSSAVNLVQQEYQKRIEEVISRVIAQKMAVAAEIPELTKITQLLKNQEGELKHLGQGIARLRHLRVYGLLFLLSLSVAVGVAATVALFRKDYVNGQKAREFTAALSNAGIDVKITILEHSTLLGVSGPRIGESTKWLKNEQGEVYGVNLVFSDRGIK